MPSFLRRWGNYKQILKLRKSTGCGYHEGQDTSEQGYEGGICKKTSVLSLDKRSETSNRLTKIILANNECGIEKTRKLRASK
jgi:hypothetical protein